MVEIYDVLNVLRELLFLAIGVFLLPYCFSHNVTKNIPL